MHLKSKTALVTGGSRGIGAATALAFAREGANVAISSRHDDADAQNTKREIEALGVKCELILADCGRVAQCEQLVAKTVAAFGSLDVLVHAAGGAVPGGLLEV